MRIAFYICLILLLNFMLLINSYGAVKIIKEKRKQQRVHFKLNTKETFLKAKKLNAYVFMIGNDAYEAESGFTPLGQCYNDVRLLERIFLYCSRVKKEDIFKNKDLTQKKFLKKFAAFVKHIKQDDPDGEKSVIITFSGHGNADGSLVFVGGKMISPNKLKALVNEFKNDTILIIDACYSGNNEGPKEMFKKEKKQGYKSNSLRIYASLAHLTAKEIKYNSPFFKPVKAFYRNVLGLKKIGGNGYFTAMIGLFFAEYKFKPNENISFKDLVSYITNKGKQYVEYLAQRENKTKRFEATVRLNQQPKILPVEEKPDWFDVNHQFIFIQDPIAPLGFDTGIGLGLFVPVGELGDYFDKPGFFMDIYLAYELSFLLENLFISVNANLIILHTETFFSRRDVDLAILMPTAGIYYRFFDKSMFNLIVGLEFGGAITFTRASSFGTLKEVNETFYNFAMNAAINFHFEVIRDLDIISRNKFTFINYSSMPLYGLVFSVGVNYHF